MLIVLGGVVTATILVSDFGQKPSLVDHVARFWLCFSLGMILYRFRSFVPLSIGIVAALGVAWWAVRGSPMERVVSVLVTGYGAVWFAALPLWGLRTLTNRVDLSYGIYIFGWPITQTLIWAWPTLGAGWHQLVATLLAFGVAGLS